MGFFSKLFGAIKRMVTTGKPEPTPEPKPKPKPTATPTATPAGGGRSRREIVEAEIPRAVRNREFDLWDDFEEYFDVETLGESEYDETV